MTLTNAQREALLKRARAAQIATGTFRGAKKKPVSQRIQQAADFLNSRGGSSLPLRPASQTIPVRPTSQALPMRPTMVMDTGEQVPTPQRPGTGMDLGLVVLLFLLMGGN